MSRLVVYTIVARVPDEEVQSWPHAVELRHSYITDLVEVGEPIVLPLAEQEKQPHKQVEHFRRGT